MILKILGMMEKELCNAVIVRIVERVLSIA